MLVSVTDCGVGISAENADRLFNAFFTTKSSGMGMGLSICRSIIEAHGGRLWATASVPHGAVFQFTLPVNADPASRSCAVSHPKNGWPREVSFGSKADVQGGRFWRKADMQPHDRSRRKAVTLHARDQARLAASAGGNSRHRRLGAA